MPLVAAMLAGCVKGDFGRMRTSFVTEGMHDWIGNEAVCRHPGIP